MYLLIGVAVKWGLLKALVRAPEAEQLGLGDPPLCTHDTCGLGFR